VTPQMSEISEAISFQLNHGRYAPSTLYGNGHVAEQIANAVATLQPYVQKKLAYCLDKHFENGTSDTVRTWNLVKLMM
jgi:hypothetical protein